MHGELGRILKSCYTNNTAKRAIRHIRKAEHGKESLAKVGEYVIKMGAFNHRRFVEALRKAPHAPFSGLPWNKEPHLWSGKPISEIRKKMVRWEDSPHGASQMATLKNSDYMRNLAFHAKRAASLQNDNTPKARKLKDAMYRVRYGVAKAVAPSGMIS